MTILQTEKTLPPPPYNNREKDGYGDSKPMMVASSPSEPSVPRRPDIKLPSGSFSRLCLQTRFADITGMYYIDAKNPASNVTSRRKKRKQKKIKLIPDAIFRSRRGNLSLDLATNGYALDVPKASVVASTRSGNISLNLIPGAENKPRFDVEVNTRSGDIVLFVPSTYSGAIQLHTKTGNLDFLPGISSEMRVVKSTDTEFLVIVGNQGGQQPLGPGQATADFCRLRSRTGNIIVGERGKDTYTRELSLWQKLTGFLRS
ncbi:hypothetical protein DFH07DRAFT_810561 [Mycena maculata]|uniref:DUF7330 domain-containing protein n=1 Tax=Mycena maculata TaxID=230809 RepID=A0AAD7NL74_9AGAR|nr:hypothetical protein DFH07DRAFT_810561 [Mycena maculata]